MNNCIKLEAKHKSLVAESHIIRRLERKLQRRVRWAIDHQQPSDSLDSERSQLSDHRRWIVRNETRATILARAFLGERPYTSVELSRRPTNEPVFKQYIVPKVVAMVNKYGTKKVDSDDIMGWARH